MRYAYTGFSGVVGFGTPVRSNWQNRMQFSSFFFKKKQNVLITALFPYAMRQI
jgi:hypothetical protein